jgi:hypothetical protein
VVRVTDVHASDADAAEVLDGLDALVQDLAGVGLEAYRQLDGVEPALGVLTVMKLATSPPTLLDMDQDITLTQQHTQAPHPAHDHRTSPSNAAQEPCCP